MIKGVQKNVFIIKDTGSEIFEQAIFIVKPKTPALSDHTLKREAEKVIELKTAEFMQNDIKRKKAFLKFLNEN